MKKQSLIAIVAWCCSYPIWSFAPAMAQKSPAKGYGEASYTHLSDDELLGRWWILAPIPLGNPMDMLYDEGLRKSFESDVLNKVDVKPNLRIPSVKVGDAQKDWMFVDAGPMPVNFEKVTGQADYAMGYALAEIVASEPQKVLMGVGSDDAIRIYLNGDLLFSHWVGRQYNQDDDLVVLPLKKGSNQLLVKVFDFEWQWLFSLRKLSRPSMDKQLVEQAGKGNLDLVKLLVEQGANLETTNELELSVVQWAQLNGRQQVVDYLKEKGANLSKPMPLLDEFMSNNFKSFQTDNAAGASVLISKDGHIVYEKQFGYADIGNKVPVTPVTKFKVGSISKQFVASAILKLQEEGMLSVNDPLSKYLPNYPNGNSITLYQLLTHTSGIPNFEGSDYYNRYKALATTTEAIIDSMTKLPVDFAPGSRFNYSNTGYLILGNVVEKVSRQPLNDYLTQTFFKPIGMSNSFFVTPQTIIDHEAYGYTFANGTPLKAENYDVSWLGGAGGLVTTSKDLLKWNEALFNGRVLSDNSRQQAFSNGMVNDTQPMGYGMGWSLDTFRGLHFVAHGGIVPGFNAYLERYPADNLNIVILTNTYPSPTGITPQQQALVITEYLLQSKLAPQPCYSLNGQSNLPNLGMFAGRYDDGFWNLLHVTADGQKLYIQPTGGIKQELIPVESNQFVRKDSGSNVMFVTDAKGHVTYLQEGDGWQRSLHKKMALDTPIADDPSRYDQLTGKYQINPYIQFDIVKRDNRLVFKAYGTNNFTLLPISNNEFVGKEFNARLKFVTDANRPASEIIMTNNGAQFTAKRIPENTGVGK